MKTITYLSMIFIFIISSGSFAQRVSQTKTGTMPDDPPTDVLNERALIGFAASDNFGNAVSEAGDVNGDGYDDMIVGAIFNDAGGSSAGRAYIYFGGQNFNVAPDVILTGDSALSYFGCSVSGAGDVNGDGYDDVIVGAYRASGFKGKAYIFYGGAAMNSVPDVTLFGIATNDNFGFSVSRAGNVNGDGYSDVIVGAYGHASSAGRAYVYFGSSSMNNVVDKVMTGVAGSAFFGYSVSNAGDVNADGFADVIVGSSGYSSATGRAYVFLGGTTMDTVVDVTMTGQAVSSEFGKSVSSAGDVNRDGYSDVIVGASGYNSATGRAYAFYGGAIMNSSSDRIFDGEAVSDNFGFYLSETGDINGDGYSDIVICADDHNSGAGRAYVYKGGPTIDNIPDKYLNGENASDNFGSFASTAGDVNGDGYADFIIGADLNDDNGSSAGKAYLYLNSMSGSEVEDIVFDGDLANDNFGNSVSSAGDVNGDGFDDILVGAKGNDQSGAGSGRCYLFLGGNVLNDSADFTFATGAAGDAFGYSVAKAGDVNGDGYDDIIMGAPFGNFNGDNAGSAYIFYGGASFNISIDVSLHGPVAGDQFGYSVSSAGDVNGDGYSDVIVGAPFASTSDGRVYVFYGGASMNNVADVTVTGASDSEFGYSVSTAGDVNGDGYDDVIAGMPQTTNGSARIYFGGFSMNTGVDVFLNGETSGDDFGISVANAGDMNGDGYGDVIVGAYLNDRSGILSGSAYIYHGGFIMNDSADVVLEGEAYEYFGNTVASAGDLNDDGFGDVMVGALDESPILYAGYVHIFHGGPSMDLIPDIAMNGNAFEDFYGWPCASAGDVNKDGKNDLLVGSYGYSGIATKQGRVYLYLNTTPQVVPALSSVKDIPFDQGGKVKLKWHKSGYDTRNNSKVTHYNIYRSDPPGTIGYQWEEIGSVNATFQSLYSYTANTNYDSTGNASGVFYFKVAARTSNTLEIWESNVMSGYSVDNLAPFAPQNLSGLPDNNSIYLTWNENTETDFHHYIIYRNDVEEHTTNVNNFDDVSVMNDSTYDYRVAAVDVHGNISQLSNLVTVTFNSSSALNLSVIMEGFYVQSTDEMTMSDTATVYLRSSSAPYPVIDLSEAVINKNTFTGSFPMLNAPTGNYYIAVKHRNSIETWSSVPVSYVSGSTNNYSFIDALSKAFGNNMTQVSVTPQRFAIYSGDVNQDGTIDGSDLQLIDNDAFNFQTGYVATDVNGDDFVDGSDAAVTDNNATNFVSKITP